MLLRSSYNKTLIEKMIVQACFTQSHNPLHAKKIIKCLVNLHLCFIDRTRKNYKIQVIAGYVMMLFIQCILESPLLLYCSISHLTLVTRSNSTKARLIMLHRPCHMVGVTEKIQDIHIAYIFPL